MCVVAFGYMTRGRRTINEPATDADVKEVPDWRIWLPPEIFSISRLGTRDVRDVAAARLHRLPSAEPRPRRLEAHVLCAT